MGGGDVCESTSATHVWLFPSITGCCVCPDVRNNSILPRVQELEEEQRMIDEQVQKGAFQSTERDKALEVRTGSALVSSVSVSSMGCAFLGYLSPPPDPDRRVCATGICSVVGLYSYECPNGPQRSQALLDHAVSPALPTEEVTRLSLAKIKRAYSIIKVKGGAAGMAAVAEEE